MSDLFDTGRNIALLRNASGLTQEEAAFRSSLSSNRFQQLEKGCRNTTMDTLIYVGRIFHVDFRVLGIFLKTDREILSMLYGVPRLPERPGDMLQVCGNILLLRKMRRLSQKQLAAMAHVSSSRLRDIEHGCANATINTLSRVSEALGLSLFQLTFLATPEKEVLRLVYDARRILVQGLGLEWHPVLDACVPSDQRESLPYDLMAKAAPKVLKVGTTV